MATDTSAPEMATPPSTSIGNPIVDRQLFATRQRVKLIDACGGLLVITVGCLAFLLVLVLIDHWASGGGLSPAMRVIGFAMLAAWCAYYGARQVLRSLLSRVNPLYAAEQIERYRPSLKNSLTNYLQLRTRPNQISPWVLEGVEQRAATDLTSIEVDHAIDRTRLVKLGTFLAVLVTIAAVYKVVSPKDPLRSAARMIAPWANLSAPTRVQISEVSPGDHREFLDRRVKVACRVNGMWGRETVTLVYSTADGQEIERRVPMSRANDDGRYFAELPDSSGGIKQDLEYIIEAGDARSGPYKVDAIIVPALAVESVRYRYPPYTLLGERTLDGIGDLAAAEGTAVTITASANDDIESASLDFDHDGAALVPMRVSERRASIDLTLRLKPGTVESEYRDYQLLLKTPGGNINPSPIQYRISVIPDEKPRLTLNEPVLGEERVIELPLGRPLNLGVVASDDYRMGSVTVHLQKGAKSLWKEELLKYDPKQPEESRPQRFAGAWLFETKNFSTLAAGDVITGWIEAADNKQPQPNIVKTDRFSIRMVPPAKDQKPQDQLANNDPKKEQPQEPKPGDPQKNDPKQGDGKQGDKGQNNNGQPQDNSKSNDPSKGNDQQPGQKGDQPMGDQKDQQPGSKSDKQQPGEQSKGGGEGQGGNQSGAGKPGENQQQPKGEQSDSKPGGSGAPAGGNNAPTEGNDSNKDQQPGQGNPQQGSKSGDKQDPGQGGAGQRRIDPENNPGEAIEQINKHFGDDKQLAKNEPKKDGSGQGQQPQQGAPDQKQQGSKDQQPGSDSKKGEGQSGKVDQQLGKNDQQAGAKDDGTNKPENSKAADSKQPGDKSQSPNNDDKQGDATKGDATKGDSAKDDGTKGEMNKDAGKQGTPEKGDAGKQDAGKQDSGNAPKGSSQPKPGEGSDAQKGDDKQGEKSPQGGEPKENENSGGDASAKGNAGAGNASKDKQSATSPQAANQPREKQSSETPNDSNKQSSDESSPSRSNKESDSKGGENGDQSGGGSKGGGQKSNQAGKGSSGMNEAADDGGSQTEGKGQGPKSDKGGDQTKGDKPSDGKSSGEKGPGSTSQPGGDKPQGETPGKSDTGDKNKSPQSGDQSGKASDKSNDMKTPQESTGDNSGGAPGDAQYGGGSTNAVRQSAPAASAPEGEDPNLEYARKATELAVERLKDQMAKGEPDPELLKKLQWTKDDAKRFLDRWQEMMRNSKQSGAKGDQARRELDETLRSLGLRPAGTQLKGDRATSDNQRGLREGIRSAPPPEYADQFKAYTTGTGKNGGK